MHRAWIARQRLDDTLAHKPLAELLVQLDALDRDLETIARGKRWATPQSVRNASWQAVSDPNPPPSRTAAASSRSWSTSRRLCPP